MINDADMKFGEVTDDSGNKIELTHGKYGTLMQSQNRETRREAFEALYQSYYAQKNTLAATFSANVKKDWFFAKTRNYSSTRERALSAYNIPEEVYSALLTSVEKYLPVMHKYVDARKRILGLDEIHFYDLYAPIVKEADISVDYEKAKSSVLASVAPLGKDYVETVKRSYSDGWIDVYENKGKRSGAFSWGVYDAPPFIFLNYDNKLNDMFTLAHEMGHAMHSYYSHKTQPYVYAGYTIFLAEVASTVNEALLMEHLLKTSNDEIFSRYLINYYIEQFRTTVFRQTMFAEFESIAHGMSQKGEPLTFDSLYSVYKNLYVKYYGDKIILDPQIEYEWTRIPHFYNSFYVYQYATGFCSAVALARKIIYENGAENYLKFLKSGSSDYSINLLKEAGVDMTNPAAIESSLLKFKELTETL
jgi:oligoendopeptidase F